MREFAPGARVVWEDDRVVLRGTVIDRAKGVPPSGDGPVYRIDADGRGRFVLPAVRLIYEYDYERGHVLPTLVAERFGEGP